MLKFLRFFAFFIAAANANAGSIHLSAGKTDADVRKAIFQNYDSKVIPPASTPGETVPVTAGLSVIYIRELDEQKEILVLDAWLKMSWVDSRLSWNPSNFSDIKSLILPTRDFWIPDLSIYTASPDVTLFPSVFTNVILSHTGEVLWVPPVTMSSRCPLQFKNYPHDVQQCEIKLGSWTMGSRSINLQLMSDQVPLEDFMDSNPVWSLEKATVRREDKIYPCCPNESYASLSYNLTLKRRPVSNICVANTISVIATGMGVFMFLLPSDSTTKFVLGALAEVLLGIVALFLNVVTEAPAAKYASNERVYPFMIAVAAFLLIEVITVHVARLAGPCRPPRCLLSASRLFCQPLESCAAAKAYDEMDDEKCKSSARCQDEWRSVATALDRILLFAALGVSVLLIKFL